RHRHRPPEKISGADTETVTRPVEETKPSLRPILGDFMHALFRRLAIGSAIPAIAIASPALAQATNFNVPSQDVTSAVRQFARQAKIQIVVSGHVAEGRRTQAVVGAMTVDQALE